MTTYATVTFHILIPGGALPVWVQDAGIVVQHIPYSNLDDVQSVGRGNFRLSVSAVVQSDVGIGVLQAAVGVVKRTMVGYMGSDWTNTILIGVSDPRKYASGQWKVNLEFMREGV